MIPSRFVLLDALPRTPTGKIDRRALSASEGRSPALSVPLVAPRTPIEVALARIWAEVLGLAQVGIHDPFLELGGHSLLAMQIVSRVLSTLRMAIDVTTLLETPTVAQMAVVITQHLARHVLREDLDGLLAEVEMLSEAEVSRRLGNAGSSEAGEDGPSRAPGARKPISESEPCP